MLEQEGFDEECYEQPQMMCHYCLDKFNLDMMEHPENKKFVYYRCSGKDWVCRARHECSNPINISWNKDMLMGSKTYVKKISHAMETMDPRIALLSIHKFHQEICKEQHHMVKMVQVGEQMAFQTYTPFRLRDEMFPVPPIGEEWSDYDVKPWNGERDKILTPAHWKNRIDDMMTDKYSTWVQTCTCQNSQMLPDRDVCNFCLGKYVKKTVVFIQEEEEEEEIPTPSDGKTILPGVPINPNWFRFNQKICAEEDPNDEPHTSKTYTSDEAPPINRMTPKEILQDMRQIAGVPEPCNWCQWRKIAFPKVERHCTGVYNLCYLKFSLFEDLPLALNRFGTMHHQLMKCDTVKGYQKLMNSLFDVDEVERAIQIKLMVDDDISFYYPYMGRVMACYDALIFRAYWGNKVLKKLNPSPVSTSEEDDEEEIVINLQQV